MGGAQGNGHDIVIEVSGLVAEPRRPIRSVSVMARFISS